MKILITDIDIVQSDRVTHGDLLIVDGVIAKIDKKITDKAEKTICGSGKTLLAGFIDMHCHLREPGYEYKENFESGLRAAVHGGFTSVCPMPNTKPIADNKVVIKYLVDRAKEVGLAKVYPIGAITKGENGEELAEILEMKDAGIVAVSDDGRPVVSANMMRLCLEYIKPYNILAISHCEDKSLADGGSVNEGYNATVAGIKGISRASEEVMVAREIILADTLSTNVHIAHVSTLGSVRLIRDAKKNGIKVTAETCPHYVAADDSIILSYDQNTKVNPPLREKKDVEAIIEGLIDGTIDVIATDHAPHHIDDKNVEYDLAAFGISGFETAFPLVYTGLVASKKMDIVKLSSLMSARPAQLLGLSQGEIKEGAIADIVIADLNIKYNVSSDNFYSKGKNTPFNGREVIGKILTTIVDGEIKYQEEN